MHGYQLNRQLADTLGGFWRVSYGSLYPTLRRLQRDGAVEMSEPEQRGGRRKNVYRDHREGRGSCSSSCSGAPQDTTVGGPRFRVRLAFFRYLPPETRIRLLERRRAYLEDASPTIKTQSLARPRAASTTTRCR